MSFKCSECKEEISKDVETCPRCGKAQTVKSTDWHSLGCCMFLILIAGFYYLITITSPPFSSVQPYEQQGESIGSLDILIGQNQNNGPRLKPTAPFNFNNRLRF